MTPHTYHLPYKVSKQYKRHYEVALGRPVDKFTWARVRRDLQMETPGDEQENLRLLSEYAEIRKRSPLVKITRLGLLTGMAIDSIVAPITGRELRRIALQWGIPETTIYSLGKLVGVKFAINVTYTPLQGQTILKEFARYLSVRNYK